MMLDLQVAWCNVCKHNRKVDLSVSRVKTKARDGNEWFLSATIVCPEGHPILAVGVRGIHESIQSEQ
jgi:hypothetical protein